MGEHNKTGFRCRFYRFTHRDWSIGLGLTHSLGETYVWFNLGLCSVYIGFMRG